MKNAIRKEYYDNGQLKLEHQEIDGDEWNGYHKRWYDNGNLWYKAIYINGMINGKHEVWIENGNRSFIEQTKKDTGHGFIIYFKYKIIFKK